MPKFAQGDRVRILERGSCGFHIVGTVIDPEGLINHKTAKVQLDNPPLGWSKMQWFYEHELELLDASQ